MSSSRLSSSSSDAEEESDEVLEEAPLEELMRRQQKIMAQLGGLEQSPPPSAKRQKLDDTPPNKLQNSSFETLPPVTPGKELSADEDDYCTEGASSSATVAVSADTNTNCSGDSAQLPISVASDESPNSFATASVAAASGRAEDAPVDCSSLSSSSSTSSDERDSGGEEDGFISVSDGEEGDGRKPADSEHDELSEKELSDVDRLLEEPYKAEADDDPLAGQKPEIRERFVQKYRNTEYFEVLPDGWLELTHKSGLAIYLHKFSRVCCLSRPYFIGSGSVKNHCVPVAAVPCLHQQRIKEEVFSTSTKQECQQQDQADSAANDEPPASGAVLRAAGDLKRRNLTAEQLRDYASRKFEFQRVPTVRFKKWVSTRQFHRTNRAVKNGMLAPSSAVASQLGRPTLPSSTQLITTSAGHQHQQQLGGRRGGPLCLNPRGKSSVALLHEYVQKTVRGHVAYAYADTRNANQPYSAAVRMRPSSSANEANNELPPAFGRLPRVADADGVEWMALGNGQGSSKKLAKLAAARQALERLVPGLRLDQDRQQQQQRAAPAEHAEETLALFDMLRLGDTRLPDLAAKAGQKSPYQVLQDCLRQNAALADTSVQTSTEKRTDKERMHWFKMRVGRHELRVSCRNKRDGKQRASQAMLRKLHPHVQTWGQLLRLYSGHQQQQPAPQQHNNNNNTDSVVQLQQSSANTNNGEPNKAILGNLRAEMEALYAANEKKFLQRQQQAGERLPRRSNSSLISIDI